MSNSIDSVVDGTLHRMSERRVAEAGKDAVGKADTQGTEQATDSLDLTGRAKELQTLQQDLAKTPEFDVARVSELKDAIANGQYEISAERIATKLLAVEAKLP